MGRKQNQCVWILGVLFSSTLTGCIFSSDFGQGTVTDSLQDMDIRPDMVVARPQDMPGDMDMDSKDQGGEPGDMVTPPDLEEPVSCTNDSDCELGQTQCNIVSNVCEACPPDVDSYSCMDSNQNPQCGIVRSPSQCNPEPVRCSCAPGYDCPDSGMDELRACKESTCLTMTSRDEICMNASCREVQYMCLSNDFDRMLCPSDSQGEVICTVASRGVMVAQGSQERMRVALGEERAVVSGGSGTPLALFTRNEEGLWFRDRNVQWDSVVIKSRVKRWYNANRLSEFEIVDQGIALDMSEDDRFMAATMKLSFLASTINGDPEPVETHVVMVFEKPNNVWNYKGMILPSSPSERLGLSLALHDNQLLIGAPREADRGEGWLHLYDLSTLDSTLSSSDFAESQSCKSALPGFGMLVDFAEFGSDTFLFSPVGANSVQMASCSPSRDEPLVNSPMEVGGRVDALSVTNGRMLIRGDKLIGFYSLTSGGEVDPEPSRTYDISSNESGNVARILFAEGMETPGVMWTDGQQVIVAPVNHLESDTETDEFPRYVAYDSFSSNDWSVGDADINAQGDIIMVIQDGDKGRVFFAKHP